MNNDLVERVKDAIGEALNNSEGHCTDAVARAAIAECFKLRDIREAPIGVPTWFWFEGSEIPVIGTAYKCRDSIAVSSAYARGCKWIGWLAIPPIEPPKENAP